MKSILIEIGELSYFAGRFSGKHLNGRLSIGNFCGSVTTWGTDLFLVGHYRLYHWFGIYAAIQAYVAGIWGGILDAVYGGHINNKRNRSDYNCAYLCG